MTVGRAAQPVDILHGGGVSLSCDPDGSLSADEHHGLFAADTRVLSTYRVTISGLRLELLTHIREGHGTARWCYQNPTFRDRDREIVRGTVFVDVRRRVDGAFHDDLSVTSYSDEPVRLDLILLIDADFADLFEVKDGQLPPRLGVSRRPTEDGLLLEYRRRDFRRALRVTTTSSGEMPLVVGSHLLFELELDHGATGRCCVEATPVINGVASHFTGDPHAPESPEPTPLTVTCAETLAGPFRRGMADLGTLRTSEGDDLFVAAGVPWFLTLFGRDSLTTTLMTGLMGCETAPGTLHALSQRQATVVDDWRDAEPGKLPHETRRGELAWFGEIPHTPYYGSHDTQSLFCLTLWNTWRWTGDRALLDRTMPAAIAALRWCDELGDRDGDGFQEYGTRSPAGYYNQSWKDAFDAIVTEDGKDAELPLATVEMQGYLFAARLAMAELFDVVGDDEAASQCRSAAREIAELVEQRFFCEASGLYALALDGHKRAVNSVASNSGHLLWCGLPLPDRAVRVAQRLTRPDMHSGWGLRTLSTEHIAYNPLSYQRGSVWPHDTALAAAGAARYGCRGEAASLLRAVLEAACMFQDDRLPELFCGFPRSDDPPVPYADANVPQAWAAAAPILATQTLLGVVPDAPHRRCHLDPWLPDWLPALSVEGIRVGDSTIDVRISRTESGVDTDITTCGDVDVRVGQVAAPLWGVPVDVSGL